MQRGSHCLALLTRSSHPYPPPNPPHQVVATRTKAVLDLGEASLELHDVILDELPAVEGLERLRGLSLRLATPDMPLPGLGALDSLARLQLYGAALRKDTLEAIGRLPQLQVGRACLGGGPVSGTREASNSADGGPRPCIPPTQMPAVPGPEREQSRCRRQQRCQKLLPGAGTAAPLACTSRLPCPLAPSSAGPGARDPLTPPLPAHGPGYFRVSEAAKTVQPACAIHQLRAPWPRGQDVSQGRGGGRGAGAAPAPRRHCLLAARQFRL